MKVSKASRSAFVLLVLAASVSRAAELQPLDESFYHDVDDTTVSAGAAHACALARAPGVDVGGAAVCWGSGALGELDAPPGLFVQLSAAAQHTCGVTLDERIVCWGGPSAPPLLRAGAAAAAAAAAASLSASAAASAVPTSGARRVQAARTGGAVAPPALASAFVQVSSGPTHACAVDTAGRLHCWGSGAKNHRGQLDAPAGAFVQVSCGADQSCALRRDGTIACWGSPRGGLMQPPAGQFLQVSVSPHAFGCAVALVGSLRCWGSLYGPTGGQGSVNGTFLQVATGPLATCAIRADGTLQCFGELQRLWAGSSTTGSANSAAAAAAADSSTSRGRGKARSPRVPPPFADTQFLELSASSDGLSMCGVTAGDEGRVVCWGESEAISAVPAGLVPALLELALDL